MPRPARSTGSRKRRPQAPARRRPQERRLLRPHAGRRAEDDRRDGREFSAEILRPAAYDADEAAAAPADLLKRSAELGITLINIPEEFEGVASSAARSRTRWSPRPSRTATWVWRCRSSRPAAWPSPSPSGGTDSQQKTYLPAFAGENVPAAAVVVSEPRALFDPFALQTQGRSLPQRLQAQRRQEPRPAAGSAETVRRRRRTRRPSGVLHRRVR
ncbi:hypothetical protein GS463_29770, partial [Rhodococcus hoagii]|nr:hypothetical protein [Prescottella equi]